MKNFTNCRVSLLWMLLAISHASVAISPTSDCGTNASQQITVNNNNCNTTSFDFNSNIGSPSLTGTCANGGARDGWGWFTATGTSTTVSCDPSGNNARNVALLIYSGTCGALTLVTCVDNDNGTGTEVATFTTVNGANYFIRVVRMSGSNGNADNDVCVINNVAPNITGFSPAVGCVGSTITINGTFLSNASSVKIGGTNASILTNSSTQITATVGSGTTGTVSVTTPYGSGTSAGTFTVNPLPLQYTVSGGGAYCSGGAGVPVNLSNSTVGIDYQLKLGAANLGAPLPGSGVGLFFGNQTTAGTYTVIATDPVTTCSRTMTGSAVVTVNNNTVINTQPVDRTICESSSTNFSVSAGGSSLAYQWQDNSSGSFANISGATNATYNLTNVALALSGRQYQCIVSGACGTVTSVVVTLTVNAKPVGVATPTSQSICSGTAISQIDLSTINNVVGTTFSWTRNQTGNISGISSSGSANPIVGTLTNSSSSTVTTTFTVTPTSPFGCVGSTFTSAVTVIPNTNITSQPNNQTKCVGTNTSFSVSTTGASITYQWQDNSTGSFADISGANSSSLSVNNVTLAMTGTQYRCIVSGTCGVATSSAATLTVNAAPVVNATSNPVNGVICGTGTVTLTATGATSYSWNPGGSTSASINVSPLTTTLYTVTGTTNGCSAQATKTVTVNPAVTASATASLTTICQGNSTDLTAIGGNSTNYAITSIPYSAPLGSGSTAVSGDDNVSGSITIPFTFSYYGVNYNNVYVYTNGFVQLGSSSSSTTVYGQTLPNAANPNNIIAGVFSDLNASTGTISTFTTGTSPNRVFSIYYNNIPFYCTGSGGGCNSNRRGNTNFQIRLYEKSNFIEIHVQNVTNSSTTTGAIKTLGIENSNGTDAKVPAGRNGNSGDWMISTPEAWRFIPNGGTLTYSWAPPIYLTNATDTNPSAVNMLLSQNYVVTITDQNGCTDASPATAITVNPLPSVNITPNGPTSFCAGGSVSLSATAGLSYVWNTIPVQTSQVITVNTGSNYTVTATDANNCSNSASQAVVTYDTLPSSIIVIGSTNLCTGQTTSDLQAIASNAVSYLWNTTESSNLITVSTGGNYSVSVTDIHGCHHNQSQQITESTPPAAPIIIAQGPTGLCSDGITTNNVVLHTTNYSSDLLWSTSEVTQDITVDYADVFNVTYTDANGCFSTSNSIFTEIKTYSVDPSSALNLSSYGEICEGSPASLEVNGGSLGSDADWYWYENGCGSGAPVANGLTAAPVPAGGGVHTYYVRAEGYCNSTVCVPVTVAVKTSPPTSTVTTVGGPASACDGTTGLLNVNNVNNATYYSWSGPTSVMYNGNNAGPYQTTATNVSATFGFLPTGSSGYSMCVFAGNACGQSNTMCKWIRAKVTMPGIISGSVTGCPNSSSVYSVAPVTGADTYTWTVIGNDATLNGSSLITATTTVPNVTVNFAAPFIGAMLQVYASLNCGFNSTARSLAIATNPVAPGAMTGNSYVCPNGNAVYSVPVVNGAATYSWSCSVPGSSINPAGNSATVSFPNNIPAGATVCVTGMSACGFPSITRCKGIATGIPNVPNNISGPAAGQCGQLGVSYSIPPVSRATTYQWSVSNGNATITGPQNLSAISVDFSGNLNNVQLTVSAGNNCGFGGVRNLTISGKPGAPAAIVGNASVCNGSVENYMTGSSQGATSLLWTVPNTALILGGQGTPFLTVLWGASGGQLKVNGVNACGNSAHTMLPISVVCRQSQLQQSLSSEVKVYPNPAHDKLNISIHSSVNDRTKIELINTIGEIVFVTEANISEGENIIELNLENNAKGFYTLSIKGDAVNSQQHVVVE